MTDEELKYYIMYFGPERWVNTEFTTLEEAKQLIDEIITELTKNNLDSRILSKLCLGIGWKPGKDIPQIVKEAEAYMWSKRQSEANMLILPDYVYEINGWEKPND